MTGADEQDVPGAHAYPLVALRRLEVLAEDVLARLEPGNAAHAGNVEQDSPADEAVLENLDCTRWRTIRR